MSASNPQKSVYYLCIENAEGIDLIAVYWFIDWLIYLFIHLFIHLLIYLCACYSHNTKNIKPNRMKFGGMIGYYPGTICLNFGINRVKVKVKVMKRSKSSFYHSTVNFYPIGMQNAKMFIIQCPILWYAKVCALPSARSSSIFLGLARVLWTGGHVWVVVCFRAAAALWFGSVSGLGGGRWRHRFGACNTPVAPISTLYGVWLKRAGSSVPFLHRVVGVPPLISR